MIMLYTLNYYKDKYFITLFAHFKHTVKIYDHCAYTQIIIKKIWSQHLCLNYNGNVSPFCFLSVWTFYFFIRFYKYYADFLLTEDISVINNLLIKSWIINILWIALITIFTAKSYLVINILFCQWLCGSVAKPIENVESSTFSLWWRVFESLEQQIFCNYYGRMKLYTLQKH